MKSFSTDGITLHFVRTFPGETAIEIFYGIKQGTLIELKNKIYNFKEQESIIVIES